MVTKLVFCYVTSHEFLMMKKENLPKSWNLEISIKNLAKIINLTGSKSKIYQKLPTDDPK